VEGKWQFLKTENHTKDTLNKSVRPELVEGFHRLRVLLHSCFDRLNTNGGLIQRSPKVCENKLFK